jgi:hypothetical protein
MTSLMPLQLASRLPRCGFAVLSALAMAGMAAPAYAEEVAAPAIAAPVAPDRIEFGKAWQPTAFLRTSWIETRATSREVIVAGKKSVLDPRQADPSPFGYRRGFIIENAQIGMKGELPSGVYYHGNVEFVPREKDGNRSPDYLRDAFAGARYKKWLDVRLGWQRAQYSQANLKGGATMTLPYAPTFDFLMPQRLMGVSVMGSEPGERVRLVLGAYNSAKQSGEQMRDLKQLMTTARVEVQVDKFFAAQKDWSWRLGTNIAMVEAHFDPPTQHRWFGVDTRARWKFLSLEAEWTVLDFFQPKLLDGTEKADRAFGWHVDLRGEIPTTRFGITARVEEMDGDEATRGTGTSLNIEDLSRQHKRWITVGVDMAPTALTRCIAAFMVRQELEGLERDDNVAQLTCALHY